MPAYAHNPDTTTANDFALQLAEREALRRLRRAAMRLAGGIIAGLVVASPALNDHEYALLWIILGMITAFLVISGYTPRILRRTQPYAGGIRGDLARAARTGLDDGSLTSPRLATLQRRTKITNILRGLAIVGLLIPIPAARLLEHRAYAEKHGDVPQTRPSANPADYPPNYLGPIPKAHTLEEMQQQIEYYANPPAAPAPQNSSDLTPTAVAPDSPNTQMRRTEPRIEYLVRHTDRRFYGVGP